MVVPTEKESLQKMKTSQTLAISYCPVGAELKEITLNALIMVSDVRV